MGRKIRTKLVFQSTVTAAHSREVSDEIARNSIKESRWALGTGIVEGIRRDVQRRVTLGQYEYRYNGHILHSDSISHWQQNEYMEWRDK